MGSVLLTRPVEDSRRTAAMLEARGHTAIVDPMLNILPIKNDSELAEISKAGFSALLFTSHNAPDCLKRFEKIPAGLMEKLAALPCFCVGERTAAAAREAGFSKIIASAGNGKTLVNLVERSVSHESGKLLHLSGENVSDGFDDALLSRGFKTKRIPVYRAAATTELSDETIEAMRGGLIDVALFFSSRTAKIFSELVSRYNLSAECASISALALSEEVAAALSPKSRWQRVVVAEAATESGMAEALEKIFPPT